MVWEEKVSEAEDKMERRVSQTRIWTLLLVFVQVWVLLGSFLLSDVVARLFIIFVVSILVQFCIGVLAVRRQGAVTEMALALLSYVVENHPDISLPARKGKDGGKRLEGDT